MTEYITKEQGIEAATNIQLDTFEREWIAEEINAIPASDVAPVVRARWEHEDVDWICSRCGMDALTEGDYRQVRSDYCPHCGARMYDEDKTVAHAYWRGIEGDGYDPEGNIVWDTFECSNCGKEHHADGEPEWDYCPNCGARMDGEHHG